MLRRFNTGYEDGKYSFVAGHIEAGESARSAIVREAKEEAGFILKPEDLHLIHVMHRGADKKSTERIDWFFTASNWEGEIINCEPHKCDDLSWFSLDNLPNNTIQYIQHAISEWQQGELYSEFGF